MSSYVRVFHSAVDPADVEEIRRLFLEDMKPAFASRPGGKGVELLVSTEKNAGGLVEGMVVSRWESVEALDAAVASREVMEAMVRVRQLLRQEPVARTFEVEA